MMVIKQLFSIFVLCIVVILSGCANKAPPKRPHDICSIFKEKSGWYEHAKKSEKRWGTPIAVMMAIVFQESSFRHNVRPPRPWFLFIPLPRRSSAYGYAQAQTFTWEEYTEEVGRWFASRSNFGDCIDFVGWYTNKARRINGISRNRADHAYLNYHEGLGGYRRGTHKKKRWLLNTATKVQERAEKYDQQLKKCRR